MYANDKVDSDVRLNAMSLDVWEAHANQDIYLLIRLGHYVHVFRGSIKCVMVIVWCVCELTVRQNLHFFKPIYILFITVCMNTPHHNQFNTCLSTRCDYICSLRYSPWLGCSSKIENIPMGIQGEKSRKDMARSGNLISSFFSTLWA